MNTLKQLCPSYYGFCLVHIWIYCSTHRPSLTDDISVMAFMYAALSAVLVAIFLLTYKLRIPASNIGSTDDTQTSAPAEKILCVVDLAGAVGMGAGGFLLAVPLQQDATVTVAIASIVGGIGAAWVYARWCQVYAALDIRLSAPLIFLTMALGSACKAVIDLLPSVPAGIALVCIPFFAVWCMRYSLVHPPVGPESIRYYNQRTVMSLVRLTFGVAVFSLTIGVIQSVLLETLPTPYSASVLVHHGTEIFIGLFMVGWLVLLHRGLDFSRTWRLILVLMATALIFEPYLEAGVSSFMLSLVRTAQTFLIIFLFLAIADVARHSTYHPITVFACGWVAYTLPFTVGKIVGDLMVTSGSDSVFMMSVMVWILVMVTLFVLDDSAAGNDLVFAGLFEGDDEDAPSRRAIAIQDELDTFATRASRRLIGRRADANTTDESTSADYFSGCDPATMPVSGHLTNETMAQRCEQLGRTYKLTPRECEILSLLVRGRSKVHIAEAFIISENTVRGHVKHIYTKLGIHNKQELLDLFEGYEV